MNDERGTYLPLSWNPENNTVGVYVNNQVKDQVALTPSNGKKLVMVECISTYRMRYAVECDEVEHAADEVTMDRVVQEFSQLHLGETIISTREINEAEYLRMFDVDNAYLRGWSDQGKLNMVHKIDYDN